MKCHVPADIRADIPRSLSLRQASGTYVVIMVSSMLLSVPISMLVDIDATYYNSQKEEVRLRNPPHLGKLRL